jgi:hypothetical protein
MLAEVGELQIKRKNNPTLGLGGGGHIRIRTAEQSLIRGGGYVMAETREDRLEVTREILVEIEKHYAVTFQTFSRANSAA